MEGKKVSASSYNIPLSEKVSNVSFGSGQNRKIFPTHAPQTRFGNKMVTIRGTPNTGPGCYENESVNNFESLIATHIVSSKGYALGARTAERFNNINMNAAPCPTSYQRQTPKTCKEAYRPFESSAERFAVRRQSIECAIPGPGTYDPNTTCSRHVCYHQSFGGNPIDVPSVKQHSTIEKNTSKLQSTKEEKKYQRKLAYLKLYY